LSLLLNTQGFNIMKSLFSFSTVPAALAVALMLLDANGLFAQRDGVWFRDPTKEGKLTKIDGEVKETISGVEVTDGAKKVTKISPADMVRIDYENLQGVDRSAQISLRPGELSGNDPEKLAAEYAKLVATSKDAPVKAKRYVAFREGYWLARAAAAKPDADFSETAKAVIAKLMTFTKEHNRSWELWQMAQEAGRLAIHIEDKETALAAWKVLADNTELPLALRHKAQLFHAGLLLRKGDMAEFKKTVMEIKADPRLDTPALKEQLAIYVEVANLPPAIEPKEGEPRTKSAGLAKVEAAITLAKDPVARAAGYNALGDLLVAQKLYRDAMWAYLWVDTVYNQDKDEQLKATSRLIDIFKRLGDEDRASQFTDRLAKLR